MRRSLLPHVPLAALLAGVLSFAACGGTKEKQPDAAAPPPEAAMMPDSTMMAMATADSVRCAGADSVRCVATADSARRAAATKKAEGPLRDSAFGPKFTVDSNGKVTPIKPAPPKRP